MSITVMSKLDTSKTVGVILFKLGFNYVY